MDEDLRRHLGLFDETPLQKAIRGLTEATTEIQRKFWLGQICSQLERNGNIEHPNKGILEIYELLNNFIFSVEEPIILKKNPEPDPFEEKNIYIKKPTETGLYRKKEFSPIEEYPVEKESIPLKTFPEPDPKRGLSPIRDPFESRPSVSDLFGMITNPSKDAVEPLKVNEDYIPIKHEVTISCSCGYSHTIMGSISGRE